MDVINLIFGGILLILGRKFFWLFVGILGFLAGLNVATRLLAGKPQWMILLFAIVAGFIGAGLAIFFQRLAIALAGFLAGGYILVNLLAVFSIDLSSAIYWALFVIGGIIGAILTTMLFDWALIVLSSIAGANLIVTVLHLNPPTHAFWLILLAIVGVIIQALIFQRDRRQAATA